MTLAEIIERHEAASWPEPIAARAAATPKGEAVRTLYRLARQLADLDAAARSDVLRLLATEIRELPTTA